jgi:hypothetical protein
MGMIGSGLSGRDAARQGAAATDAARANPARDPSLLRLPVRHEGGGGLGRRRATLGGGAEAERATRHDTANEATRPCAGLGVIFCRRMQGSTVRC